MNPLALPPPIAGLAQAIRGVWRLETREDYDRRGVLNVDPILGARPLGMVAFSPRHFAAQFMNRERPAAPAPAVAAGPGANNSGAVGGYDAYFGTYTLDEAAGTITVMLEGGLDPADVGKALTREIRVAEGRLIIRLDTTAADGTAVTRTLVFARLL